MIVGDRRRRNNIHGLKLRRGRWVAQNIACSSKSLMVIDYFRSHRALNTTSSPCPNRPASLDTKGQANGVKNSGGSQCTGTVMRTAGVSGRSQQRLEDHVVVRNGAGGRWSVVLWQPAVTTTMPKELTISFRLTE